MPPSNRPDPWSAGTRSDPDISPGSRLRLPHLDHTRSAPRAPQTDAGRDERPPLPVLFAAAVLATAGLALALLPGVPSRGVLAAWFLCGVVTLGLVVVFTHLDVQRRASGRYLGNPLSAALRSGVLAVAVVGVVVSAVRVALIVGRSGWTAL